MTKPGPNPEATKKVFGRSVDVPDASVVPPKGRVVTAQSTLASESPGESQTPNEAPATSAQQLRENESVTAYPGIMGEFAISASFGV
jgi:hypothetical protein